MVMVSLICVLLAVFKLFWGFGMDVSLKTEEEEVKKFGSKILALSEYASALESHVKLPKENLDSGHRPFHHSM